MRLKVFEWFEKKCFFCSLIFLGSIMGVKPLKSENALKISILTQSLESDSLSLYVTDRLERVRDCRG